MKYYLSIIMVVLLLISGCGDSMTNTDNTSTTQNDITTTDDVAVYRVQFDLNANDAEGQPRDQYVEEGHTATRPNNPTLEGYIFSGWYTQSICIYGWAFEAEVTEDMTLYACWYEEGSNQLPL